MAKMHRSEDTIWRPCSAKIKCPLPGSPHIEGDSQAELHEKINTIETDLARKDGLESTSSISKPGRSAVTKEEFEEPTIHNANPVHRYDMKWFGSNYERIRGMGTTEIAKEIRNEVKQAVNDGYLPKDHKYSVRKHHEAINITVRAPGRDRDKYIYSSDYHGRMERKLNPESREVLDRARKVHDSFNQNSSDSMTDYSDVAFYGGVTYDSDHDIAWDNNERETNKYKRFIRDERKKGRSDEDIAKDPAFRKQYDNLMTARRSVLLARAESEAVNRQVKEAKPDTFKLDIDWDRVDKEAENKVHHEVALDLQNRERSGIKETGLFSR